MYAAQWRLSSKACYSTMAQTATKRQNCYDLILELSQNTKQNKQYNNIMHEIRKHKLSSNILWNIMEKHNFKTNMDIFELPENQLEHPQSFFGNSEIKDCPF